MFINELNLYMDYFKKRLETDAASNPKQVKQLQAFKKNLMDGIEYYNEMVSYLRKESNQYIAMMKEELEKAAQILANQNLSLMPGNVTVPA